MMEERKHLRKSLVDDRGKENILRKRWRKENIYVKVLSMIEERKHLRKSLVDDGGKKTFT